MDSLAEEGKGLTQERATVSFITGFYVRANARSAVRVSTGEAGEAFALFFAVFALKS